MCNACHNICCGSDQFERCGCDGCDEPDCWSDDADDDGADDFGLMHCQPRRAAFRAEDCGYAQDKGTADAR